jgi:RNA-dependent RNA polymerase
VASKTPSVSIAHLPRIEVKLTCSGLQLAALHSKAVDYVKTGQPAEMPKGLRPSKWPHFMEKKHKPSYQSDKILGKLYDRVQTVHFVPQWEEPFDRRILRAYKLDNIILKAARQVKSEYDMAMRRIMAQQEIETEFEIWSTFVLSRPRVGSDYKLQEDMAVISDALKGQYRQMCLVKAGCAFDEKDFSKLGPFVAAMYKVTKEELDIALAECRSTKMIGGRLQPARKMEQKYMPLISFPWLFEKELGRIATGEVAEGDEGGVAGLGLLPRRPKGDGPSRKRGGAGEEDIDDFIQQEDGVIVHRGEELDLFRPDVESNDLSGESDYDEARSVGVDGSYVVGESGGLVLNTVFQAKPTPGHLLSGTGVEDVVPRTELDGFVHPREAAQHAHESNTYGEQLATAVNPGAHGKPALSLSTSTNFVPQNNPSLSPTTNTPPTGATPPSTGDLMVVDKPVLIKSEPGVREDLLEFEDLQGEEFKLDVEKSSLGKFAKIMESESVEEEGVEEEGVEEEEVEEEEVKLDMEESSLEKLARMMDS